MGELEKLAIEHGAKINESQDVIFDTDFDKNGVMCLKAFAKALQQSSEPVAEPLRINLGFGKYGIHHGTIDKVPCLTISNIGTGLVGEQTKHENMTPIKFENEVLSITFANKESFEVFRQEVNLVFPHPPASVSLEKYNRAIEALKLAKTFAEIEIKKQIADAEKEHKPRDWSISASITIDKLVANLKSIVQAIAEAEGKEG